MESDNIGSGPSPKQGVDALVGARIATRDARHLDPSERAELFQSFLFHALDLTGPDEYIQHPLYWDLLSFCIEQISLFGSTAGDERLEQLVKILSKHFYSLHYSFPDDAPQLGLDREAHKAEWIELIEGYI